MEVEVVEVARTHRTKVAICAIFVVMLLMGCDPIWSINSAADDDIYAALDADERAAASKDQGKYKAEPDQALASGQVLSVRVNYGQSGAAQCQVRIDNDRNDWYDEVEFIAYESSLGNSEKPYDDYGFGSENFNKQITNPNNAPLYTPEAVKGAYRITVTADNGYNASATVTWDGKRFSPSLLSFSLD